MSPVGGDQLTMALNPSKLCTVVGRGTDLGTRGLNIKQINNTRRNKSQSKKKEEKSKKKRKQNNRSSTFVKKNGSPLF